jgi:hypothetical protein
LPWLQARYASNRSPARVMGLPVGAAAPSSVDLERCQVAGSIWARRMARLAANTASQAPTASVAASMASEATSRPGCPVGWPGCTRVGTWAAGGVGLSVAGCSCDAAHHDGTPPRPRSGCCRPGRPAHRHGTVRQRRRAGRGRWRSAGRVSGSRRVVSVQCAEFCQSAEFYQSAEAASPPTVPGPATASSTTPCTYRGSRFP